jgi:hypothetical protein
MVKRIRAIIQDRWNEIFEAGCNYEGEQNYIDFDRKAQYGKPLPFSLSIAQSAIAYYDKAFVQNLKANMSFGSIAVTKPLPNQKGKSIQMFSYKILSAEESVI